MSHDELIHLMMQTLEDNNIALALMQSLKLEVIAGMPNIEAIQNHNSLVIAKARKHIEAEQAGIRG